MSEVATAPVVRVENLCLSLNTGEPVVEDVSFSVGAGEILGLVGESGSGKTTTALALLGYTRTGVNVRGGHDRGRRPEHHRPRHEVAARRARQGGLLRAAGPGRRAQPVDAGRRRDHGRPARPPAGDASTSRCRPRWRGSSWAPIARFGDRYPHQLSGGQQQRVTIAMACVVRAAGGGARRADDRPRRAHPGPDPDRAARLRDEDGMAMVYVSHDLAVVAKMADRIVVMYAGRVVENGPAADVIERPKHPYTRALVAAIPDFRHPARAAGHPRRVGRRRRVAGRLRLRAALRAPAGRAATPASRRSSRRPSHAVRCVRWEELTWASARPRAPASRPSRERRALLEVSGLEARYRYAPRQPRRRGRRLVRIPPGRCVALVGESGSGKTTVGRCIAGLHAPTSGRIAFDGAGARRAARRARSTSAGGSRSCSRTRSSRSTRGTACARRSSGRCGCCAGSRRGDADREVGELLERVRLPRRSPTASRSSSRAASASGWRSRGRWRPSPTCWSATR